MRTTVTLQADVAEEVKRLRRERGLGPSEAINELARRGMTVREPSASYEPQTAPLGLRLDVSNVGEVLELLDATPS
jgi:hypothetical protein